MENRSEVEAAAARAAATQVDVAATRRLYEGTKSVSKEELDRKELEQKLAEAEFQRLEMTEAREKIEYDMAQEQLQRRFLNAPITGVVLKLLIEEGENCEPRQPLLRLVDVDRAYFVANVPTAVAPQFPLGQVVEIEVPAGAEVVKSAGTISFVSPVVDSASDLREIKARFENPQGKVQPGVAGVMRPVGKHE
jgi:RND family efflux transporter MFP subunit